MLKHRIPIVKVFEFTSTAYIYPIFKNGATSLGRYIERNKCKILVNEQINRCNTITIYIREPKERFISGVHTYIEFEKQKGNKIDYKTILKQIENKEITNEHFATQFEWIKKLAKYFDFWVEFVNVDQLYKLIPDRLGPPIPSMSNDVKKQIADVKFDLTQDYIIWNEWLNKRENIKDFINVLSKA